MTVLDTLDRKEKMKLYWDLAKGLPTKDDRATLREIFELCAQVQKKAFGMQECHIFFSNKELDFGISTDRINTHLSIPGSLEALTQKRQTLYPTLDQTKSAKSVFDQLAEHHAQIAADIRSSGTTNMDSYTDLIDKIADDLREISDLCNKLSNRMDKRLGTMARYDRSDSFIHLLNL